MCFTIFWKEETPLWTLKRRSWKSGKIGIFSNGLVHGFGQKLVIFPGFYFRENRTEKCGSHKKKMFYVILDKGNAFLEYKNKELKILKNSGFCEGVSSWFLSKIGNFSTFLFWGE